HFDVAFNETSGQVFKRDLGTPGPAHTLAEEVADEIISEYYSWRGCLNSYAIREWIRAELNDVNATTIKRGVYFISPMHQAVIDQLTAFVRDLPGSSMFHTIPLPDTTAQREMLEAAYAEEATSEIDDLLQEMVK